MEYAIGTAVGAIIFFFGLITGLRMNRMQKTPESQAAMTDEQKRIAAEHEERQRQWDNLCNYMGRRQVTKHEN